MKLEKNCLIIAGEKSGEEHCLTFLNALQSQNPELHFWGVGGDELSEQGMELLYHLKDFSSWGFTEVFAKVPFYINALKTIVKEVDKRQCKMAILIDFQDFNMRLARKLRDKGVKVFYYVAPQAWAWKSWRVKALSRNVETLFTILPFEKEWFTSRGVNQVIGIENPVFAAYKQELAEISAEKGKKRLVLLPGSRHFEVLSLLPLFYRVIRKLQKEFDLQITVVRSPSIDEKYYQSLEGITVIQNSQLPEVLKSADLALAASGTVTLTCALFQVPTVVCYKSSYLNEYIFNTFISYSGPISLPNIILGETIFPELLQDDANEYNMLHIMKNWLGPSDKLTHIRERLAELPEMLKGDGVNIGTFLSQKVEEIYA